MSGAGRVYLIDDDEAVRAGLALLLRTVGYDVRAFADPLGFLAQRERLEPGPLVVDIRMPGMSGLALLERLAADGFGWPVIMVTGHGDVAACRRAFKSGAVDFLTKPVDEDVLIEAIQAAGKGLAARLASDAETRETRALIAQLTPREREILDLVAKGLTTREMAELLALSPRTIESHRANLGAKLGTTSVAELTRLGLADPGGAG